MRAHFPTPGWPQGPVNRRYAVREAVTRLFASRQGPWEQVEGEEGRVFRFEPTLLGRITPRWIWWRVTEMALTLSALRTYGEHLTAEARHQHCLERFREIDWSQVPLTPWPPKERP